MSALLPGPTHRRVLRAALLEGEPGARAFAELAASVELDDVDTGTYLLLPLLARTLAARGTEHPWRKRLKGTHRLHWCKNQLALRAAGQLIGALEGRGVPTLVLKGGALASRAYPDLGSRPMGDLDLLVPTAMAGMAMRALEDLGYHAVQPHPELAIETRHSTAFRHASGAELDLHWHVLQECLGADADDPFWEAAVPLKLGGAATRMLGTADQLLHLLVHGLVAERIPPVRWAADAVLLLRAEEDQMDWERLTTQAATRRLSHTVAHGLAFLRDVLDAPVPDAALARLRAAPHDPIEDLELAFKGHRLLVWAVLPQTLAAYLRRARDVGEPASLGGFWGFLAHRLFLRSGWELVWALPARVLGRIGRALAGRWRRLRAALALAS